MTEVTSELPDSMPEINTNRRASIWANLGAGALCGTAMALLGSDRFSVVERSIGGFAFGVTGFAILELSDRIAGRVISGQIPE